MGNPVKRTKIIAKLKKENMQINFLQETHLSNSEHEKKKDLGLETLSIVHTNSRKRGVAILVANSVNFVFKKGNKG